MERVVRLSGEKIPKLSGAMVVTDMRLVRYLYEEGWYILHHEMREVEDDPDPSAIDHRFVVFGIPENTVLEEMEKYSLFPVDEQRNVTRDRG